MSSELFVMPVAEAVAAFPQLSDPETVEALYLNRQTALGVECFTVFSGRDEHTPFGGALKSDFREDLRYARMAVTRAEAALKDAKTAAAGNGKAADVTAVRKRVLKDANVKLNEMLARPERPMADLAEQVEAFMYAQATRLNCG